MRGNSATLRDLCLCFLDDLVQGRPSLPPVMLAVLDSGLTGVLFNEAACVDSGLARGRHHRLPFRPSITSPFQRHREQDLSFDVP